MIREDIEKLEVKDIYSLILFALYKIKDIPEYSTISELAYILDKDSLLNFLEYFGGMQLRVPTLREFKLVLNSLLLYEYVNIEGIEFNKALKLLDKDEYQLREIRSVYYSLSDILSKYNFKR